MLASDTAALSLLKDGTAAVLFFDSAPRTTKGHALWKIGGLKFRIL